MRLLKSGERGMSIGASSRVKDVTEVEKNIQTSPSNLRSSNEL